MALKRCDILNKWLIPGLFQKRFSIFTSAILIWVSHYFFGIVPFSNQFIDNLSFLSIKNTAMERNVFICFTNLLSSLKTLQFNVYEVSDNWFPSSFLTSSVEFSQFNGEISTEPTFSLLLNIFLSYKQDLWGQCNFKTLETLNNIPWNHQNFITIS